MRRMNYWRMSFRVGDQGYEMWPDCYERGIAAIGYYNSRGKPIVNDCSKLTEDEYNEIWRRKDRYNPSARTSLRNVAYQMRKGDTIYTKQGPYIVGKGKIVKEYKYDPEILEGTECKWEHYVRVDWDRNFAKFRLNLGANQITVLKLNAERLKRIRKIERQTLKEAEVLDAIEGQRHTSEATFLSRNRALIEAKKANSDYRCEVCDMCFKEDYGKIGDGYIIAHHKNPVGGRKRPSKTTRDDIALVCSNCHDMMHRTEPPMTIEELRNRLRR